MSLKLIEAPAVPVVSLTDMKAHMRVDHDDDDDLIEGLVVAATQHLDGRDGWLGRAFITQTWELILDGFPHCEMRIPLPPLQSVESVKYDDAAGVEQTLAADKYTVDTASEPGWIVPVYNTRWPVTLRAINAVRVQFICGYPGDGASPEDLTANVPRPIVEAVKRIVGTLYEIRETVIVGSTPTKVSAAAEAMLAPYRVWR